VWAIQSRHAEGFIPKSGAKFKRGHEHGSDEPQSEHQRGTSSAAVCRMRSRLSDKRFTIQVEVAVALPDAGGLIGTYPKSSLLSTYGS
jgi:hypothetical protein